MIKKGLHGRYIILYHTVISVFTRPLEYHMYQHTFFISIAFIFDNIMFNYITLKENVY